MIGKLTGVLDSVGEDWAMVDVGGVGYVAQCSARTLRALPRPGEPVRLLVETELRDDRIQLFGFAESAERQWFRLLQTVQGVGTRVALAILSVLSPAEVMQAIAAQDRGALGRASGVGPKLAQRIVNELRDKVADGGFGDAAAAALPAGGEPAGAAAEAVSALVNLGYRRAEAFSAVARAARELGPGAAVEALIRSGLKELAR